MIEMSTGGLAIRSPFSVAAFGAAGSVYLEDRTDRFALIYVQGERAPVVLAQAFGHGPLEPGDVSESKLGLVATLRHDAALVLGLPGAVQAVTGRIAEVAGAHVTALDVSHGRGLLALSGPSAAAVLSKLCGLDFGERSFPHMHAAQTSLARVRALIVRADEGATRRYFLAVDRSHGVYIWETLADAMQEFLAGV